MKLSKVEDGKHPANLHRTLTLEMVRVTERAAIAAAEWRGKGNEKAADEAAVAAMKAELDEVSISGRIVIGEGEQYEVDNLYVGQPVGAGQGPDVDIAVDPLEGFQKDRCIMGVAELTQVRRKLLGFVARAVHGRVFVVGRADAVDVSQQPFSHQGNRRVRTDHR